MSLNYDDASFSYKNMSLNYKEIAFDYKKTSFNCKELLRAVGHLHGHGGRPVVRGQHGRHPEAAARGGVGRAEDC